LSELKELAESLVDALGHHLLGLVCVDAGLVGDRSAEVARRSRVGRCSGLQSLVWISDLPQLKYTSPSI
jgi:hypothetical protein